MAPFPVSWTRKKNRGTRQDVFHLSMPWAVMECSCKSISGFSNTRKGDGVLLLVPVCQSDVAYQTKTPTFSVNYNGELRPNRRYSDWPANR